VLFTEHHDVPRADAFVRQLVEIGRRDVSFLGADDWPDDVRLSDIENRFICTVCGKRGADIRSNPDWSKKPVGY
jgi:hypothetical protein